MDKPVPPQAASSLLTACAIRNRSCACSPNWPRCLSRHQDFLSCPLWTWMPFQPKKLLSCKAIITFLRADRGASFWGCQQYAVSIHVSPWKTGQPALPVIPSSVTALSHLSQLLHQDPATEEWDEKGHPTPPLLCDRGKQQPPGARRAEHNFDCTHATSEKNVKEECSKKYVNY